MNIEKSLKFIKLPKTYYHDDKKCFFDPYRKRLIDVTPEETVRQKIAGWLEHECGVPKECINIEIPMSYYSMEKRGRADIIVSEIVDGYKLLPVAVVECKNEHVTLTDNTLEQAIRYCDIIGGLFVIITNGRELEIARYYKETQSYTFLDDFPTYEEMIDGKCILPKQVEKPCDRFTIAELNDQNIIGPYNDGGMWVYGRDTSPAIRSLAVNIYQCLIDSEHRLPPMKRKAYELIEDIGIRYLDYSNAGGGHYCGDYRSFLVKDRRGDNQIISISIFGTASDMDTEKRNSYTSLIGAIDNYKTSHNSIQYNMDRFTNFYKNNAIFNHNGQISSYKNRDMVNWIHKYGDGVKIENGMICIGELPFDKVLYLSDLDVVDFFYNFIEYTLLREEMRKDHKNKAIINRTCS